MASVKHVLGLGAVVVALAASGLAIASNQDEQGGDQRHSKMQMRMDKRMGELKAELAITAAQEGSVWWHSCVWRSGPPVSCTTGREE